MPLPALPAAPDQIHLRLLATTDLHVHILPYDYYADRPTETIGLVALAGLIGQARAGARNTLLLDNGDVLQGSPMGDYIAEVRGVGPDRIHPAIAAMNVLGYDAATLGNHEFNYGLDYLKACLAGTRFPVVCANVLTRTGSEPLNDETLLPPYVILTREMTDGAGRPHSVRIGVIGALPPQILVWDRTHLEGRVDTRDIVETIAARVPQMKAEGAEIIIALCHSGIGPVQPLDGMEHAATAVAALPGIDAVVAGHTHLVFPVPGTGASDGVDPDNGTLAGTPAVMAGCFGSHLGVIDLLLQHGPAGWNLARARSQALPTPAAEHRVRDARQAAILAATQADHVATLAHIRRPVGRTTCPLTTFFAVLPGSAALALIARAQQWHVARALQGTALGSVPLLSAAAPFKMGGRGGPDYYTDVPAGDLALRHVADLYAYPNTIRAVLVTGAELHDWIERAAGVFNLIQPGQPDQPLINPEVPSSQFDVIEGVGWTVDLSQPAKYSAEGVLVAPTAQRVRDLRYQGRPIAPTDRFLIATNNYRAGGGAGFPGAQGDTIVFSGRDTNRDNLRRYIAQIGTIGAPGNPAWQFHPMPGTSLLYDTSPRAVDHMGTVPLRIQPAGCAPGGFARFRIHL